MILFVSKTAIVITQYKNNQCILGFHLQTLELKCRSLDPTICAQFKPQLIYLNI